ncbi:deoxyribose-phosphate aldolase [Desulfotomaculum copahuensis]|uniref:Deoxyribose-phosphate aldolase n=1 Tax=Desulfotomaculum copahuensis TaxID=1838280 RepID=A0A1B7LCE0_9FIRM|nr:deoxyribose-phosphate aldolase [Desulfotomaculum copahuensis]OAT80427.1 deoxyribose-phosphate aldolase [Desulfotomaculum copahuensis]
MDLSKRQLAAMIDHTLLKPTAGTEDIRRLCIEAVRDGFAAVCVNPVHVATAARFLTGSPVAVCTVTGFPLGANTPETKAQEARQAASAGAAEVDMVLNIGALKDGDDALVEADIRGVVAAIKAVKQDGLVKVILETGYLTEEEKVRACRLAGQAGAHFVKTSTGFGPAGATAADVALLRRSIPAAMGVKAAGGIRTIDQALAMIAAGATRLGTSSGVAIVDGISSTPPAP